MEPKLNILLISSESLYRTTSRLALDQYQALKAAGHSVDVLTKYDDSDNPDIISVLGTSAQEAKAPFVYRAWRKMRRMLQTKDQRAKYYFFYTDEKHPPVPTDRVVGRITKSYDLVLILFWQGLLSAQTVWEIHQKTKCPMLFLSVDMSPLTGGCHYFWDCERFKVGCGCCPAIGSKNPKDFTNFNSQYRHEHFAQIQGAFLGNDYMNVIAHTSYALQGMAIERGAMVVNETWFCPRDKAPLRKDMGIDGRKQFVLFAGAQSLSDSRKGMDLLIESLNQFYASLTKREQEEVLVVFAGHLTPEAQDRVNFETLSLGYIDFDQLALVYAAADVFLSPSILDAGPMMVNQALSCGTPVVAFEMGCALEVIKGHHTGYCAKLGDVADFTQGIRSIYVLNATERAELSRNCRAMAMHSSSYAYFASTILAVYQKVRNGGA